MKLTKRSIFALLLVFAVLLTGCQKNGDEPDTQTTEAQNGLLGDAEEGFGNAIADLGAYKGFFEGESTDVVVKSISGSSNCFELIGNTLCFTKISADTVCSVSGTLRGNIIIDVGNAYRFDLELHGLSLVSDNGAPIVITSGDEVTITAKKSYQNYIYDLRAKADDNDTTQKSGAIHSEVDLEIAGKGELAVVSEHNDGIHSKKDLQVKNLKLLVACADNALKGNDTVELSACETTLIATDGDGIKTSNSDISSKGNQRGTVSVQGGVHKIYAACDGIDAAYDVEINDSATVLEIYTDKYSNYSNEVTATNRDTKFIRSTTKKQTYSVKYTNSDGAVEWVNPEYHAEVKGTRTTYYYYAFPQKSGFDKLRVFVYEAGTAQGQEETYFAASEILSQNDGYDTIALSLLGGTTLFSWTNYGTKIAEGGFGGGPNGLGGPGGMQDANADKGDHSTKGIKAANEIRLLSGNITVKSYDDALHASNDTVLENGNAPLGNLTVKGGSITLYTNDDGIHADGAFSMEKGTVSVINSHEGIEASTVSVTGGSLSLHANDDGINAMASMGTSVSIGGGRVYLNCKGDGIDSNSQTAYEGIVFAGGQTVIISNSGSNSAIDTEQGYRYSGGSVIALMPQNGMTGDSTYCESFGSLGTALTVSLTEGQILSVAVANTQAIVKMPCSLSAMLIVLGDSAATFAVGNATSAELDANGVAWN